MTRAARALLLAALTSTLSIGAARPAAADPDSPAAREFREGQQAFARGDFRGAAKQFEAAFRDDPRGASVFNAGLSWQAAGDTARAADDYAFALATTDLPADNAADARTRLGALEKSLARIDVTAPAGSRVSVAHADRLLPPAHVHVLPGTYVVHVMLADDSERQRTLSVLAGEWAHWEVEAAPAPAPRTEPRAPAAVHEAPPEPGSSGTSSTQRTWGWVTLGVAGVLAGVSTWLTVQFFDANATNDSQRKQGSHDDATAAATRLDVALGATVVAAGVGVALILTAPDSTTSVGMSATPGGATLHVSF
jgi:hypothetical protein